jgi:hypothetical protein
MASISKEPNGRRTIQFVGPDGKRRSIRLGKVSQRTADGIKVRVEALVEASSTGSSLTSDTAAWLTDRDQVMLDKLAAVGLVPKRSSATLGIFLDEYVASRIDTKPATRKTSASTWSGRSWPRPPFTSVCNSPGNSSAWPASTS